MAARIRLPNAWTFIVIGFIVAVIAVFMVRGGYSHRTQYNSFQQCVREGAQPICVLHNNGSQARSVGDFKQNYQNQILLGTLGAALGGVLVVTGAVRLVIRRRSPPSAPSGSNPL